MRLVSIVTLFAFATPTLGADKDEDKAKEVATAFMKGVKAKDLDAIMKTVDLPFLIDVKGNKVVKKTEDLKADLKELLKEVKEGRQVPTDVSEVLDLPAIRKRLAEVKDDGKLKAFVEGLGGKVYAVRAGKPLLIVQVKDGTAKVVGLPK